MASALGVKQPTISEWLRGDRQVPAERCPVIERETRARGGEVRCEELRSDVPWEVLRLQAAPDLRKADLGPAARTSKTNQTGA